MKVLVFTDGFMTVINGSDMFKGAFDKPSFINGELFFYEPTNYTLDGRELTESEKSSALAYIDAFDFAAVVPPVQEAPVPVHCVDQNGDYLGFMVNTENYAEVATAPSDRYKEHYSDGAWVKNVCVYKDSKKYAGELSMLVNNAVEYVVGSGAIPEDFSNVLYSWSGSGWTISLEDAKECRRKRIFKAQNEATNAMMGFIARAENVSYSIQAEEAKRWNADNNETTDFIDALLAGRNFGEIKQELVSKILAKNAAFSAGYGSMLGKFHNVMKRIDDATSVETVISIVW